MFGRHILATKTDEELRGMRRAGLVVARTLQALEESCTSGTTTRRLDALAEARIRRLGGRPSFAEVPGYRHTLCVSVNEQVVHGIPGDRVLRDGDIVSIDCGAIVDGWHGDAAVTVVVGGRQAVSAETEALVDATREALWAGILAFRVGGSVGDIGAAVEDSLSACGRAAPGGPLTFGIVDGFEGHGIGREMHMDPPVPNVKLARKGPKVRPGATVAIEPMATLGTQATRELEDGWTAVTCDGSWAAHWEHTVAVTDRGLWVLTSLDGGQAELTARGAAFGPV